MSKEKFGSVPEREANRTITEIESIKKEMNKVLYAMIWDDNISYRQYKTCSEMQIRNGSHNLAYLLLADKYQNDQYYRYMLE